MAEGILFFILFCIVLHLIDRAKELDREIKKIDSKISEFRRENMETYDRVCRSNDDLIDRVDVLIARVSQ